jgi:hypothetical protein
MLHMIVSSLRSALAPENQAASAAERIGTNHFNSLLADYELFQ